jgi:MSHA biogenesis protein MshJ
MRWLNKQSYALRLLIDKIPLRQRHLALVTLFSLTMALSQLSLVLMGLDKHNEVLARIENLKQNNSRITETLTAHQQAANNPVLLALSNSNIEIEKRIDQFRQNIRDINSKLMSPESMIQLLRGLLEKQNLLSIVHFEVLPVKTVESTADNSILFYRHSIHLQLEGRFEALADYLQAIETTTDNQLFWDNIQIETENFPTLQIKINVHTLSQDEEWLNV